MAVAGEGEMEEGGGLKDNGRKVQTSKSSIDHTHHIIHAYIYIYIYISDKSYTERERER